MGSNDASNVNNQMTYFLKRGFRKSGPLEKAGPGPLQKADYMPKVTVLAKNTFLTNRGLLISNMTIIFQQLVLKFFFKHINQAILAPKLRIFHFYKFEDADFKYDNTFQTHNPKYSNKAIYFQI